MSSVPALMFMTFFHLFKCSQHFKLLRTIKVLPCAQFGLIDYTIPYRFDFFLNELTREIDLFVPKPVEACIQKYASGVEEPILVAGTCLTEAPAVRRAPRFNSVSVVAKDSVILTDYFSNTRTRIKRGYFKDGRFEVSDFNSSFLGGGLSYSAKDQDSILIFVTNSNWISRLEEGSGEPEVVLHVATREVDEGTGILLLSASVGPGSNQIVYSYRANNLLNIFLKDLCSGSEVDLINMFTVRVPANTPRTKSSQFFDQGYGIADVVFDNSLADIVVALATYSYLVPPDGNNQRVGLHFAIFFADKQSMSNWIFFDSFSIPVLNDNHYFKRTGVLIPLVAQPVVKNGVIVISAANTLDSTLSFYKYDYSVTLLEFFDASKVLPFAAVMRDSATVETKISVVMNAVSQSISERFPGLRNFATIGDPQYERARKSLLIANRITNK